MNKHNKSNTNLKKIAIIAVSAIILLAIVFSIKVPGDKKQTASNPSNKTTADTTETTDTAKTTDASKTTASSDKTKEKTGNVAKEVKDSDIVIPVSDVTDKAKFYPAVINGTKLEVLAVKAPDGTIRTAFNTCQVCYGSGRGYYKQEGDQLICQNCGNSFGMGDVEVTKGGCNPVPITDEYKKVDDKNITITKDTLAQATQIFANWKTNVN